MKLPLTGSQTVGPYFAIGMEDLCSESIPSAADGERYTVEGFLLDGQRNPIPDGLLEVWQADTNGEYGCQPASSPAGAAGFARVKTKADGSFRFSLIKPGRVFYDTERLQAPHLLVLVYMRGLLRNPVTRLYFPNEPSNLTDPVLALVPPERRPTLIAEATGTQNLLHWDIVMRQQDMQDNRETVFFAW
jgi:protocatechuate 3,4-dioxygenase alpha subunit